MKFFWDESKNRANKRKHNVSFEESQELFRSGNYVEIFDVEHSVLEARFFAIGPIARGLIVVVWTEGQEDEIRIISARTATKVERQLYKSYMENWQ